jgi:hypothetical protein
MGNELAATLDWASVVKTAAYIGMRLFGATGRPFVLEVKKHACISFLFLFSGRICFIIFALPVPAVKLNSLILG